MTRTTVLLVALAGTASAEPKRDVPDYDGRGNPDAKPDDALWLPRVLLSPLYFVHEYVVRRPLGALVSTAEREHWVDRFIYLGPNHDVYWFPTFLYDFGMLPSAGLSLHDRRFGVRNNSLHLHAATWGPSWLAAHAEDRYTWDDGKFAEATRVEFSRRSDNLFFGVGPDVTNATRARYGLQRFDATQTLARKLVHESALSITAGVRASALRGGTAWGDPALSDLIASGATTMPPGYDQSHLTVYERASLRLDSRAPRPATSTGVYLELHGEDHVDVHTSDAWLRYGGEAGVAVDLYKQRTIRVYAATELVDPLGPMSDVPFYELAQLGGDDSMSAFLLGWMNGRSTATGGVAYTWPVWTWLDGQLRLSAGNAFGQHLSGFAPAKLRLSADLGMASNFARDAGLQLLLGVGTETFEQGGRITSVRLALGSRRGF